MTDNSISSEDNRTSYINERNKVKYRKFSAFIPKEEDLVIKVLENKTKKREFTNWVIDKVKEEVLNNM